MLLADLPALSPQPPLSVVPLPAEQHLLPSRCCWRPRRTQALSPDPGTDDMLAESHLVLVSLVAQLSHHRRHHDSPCRRVVAGSVVRRAQYLFAGFRLL